MSNVNTIRGFKALNNDMTSEYGCMKYDLNKWYHHEGEIELCKNGFHFCKELFFTTLFYDCGDCRFFEIESKGDIIDGDCKSVCSDIRLIREISKEEFIKYYLDNVNKLSNDDSSDVRYEVAKNPNTPISILKKLSEDSEEYVRYVVAKNPNTPISILKKLSEDDEWRIRNGVAENSNTPINILEKLSNDSRWRIRYQVAENSNTPINILEKLSNDSRWRIRYQVAKNPNTTIDILEKLSNDDDSDVRYEANKTFK